MRNVKSTLIDVYKKKTEFDKSLGIVANGVDNLYPERADRFINNSVTAKTCAKIMATYLMGKGWLGRNKVIVNKEKMLTLQHFTSKIAHSLVKQRGVFIHVNYNANFEPSSYDVLPYVHCRVGKRDDNKYNGKIAVSDKWDNSKLNETDITFINVFNPDKKVVQSQINKVKGEDLTEKIRRYKGQVLYLNLDDDYVYALSQIDAVMNDCDSEAQASVYKNKSLRKGFFGKTLVVTRPLAGSLEDYTDANQYHEAQSERSNFKDTIKDFIGAENVGDTLHVELEFDDNEKLDNAILFKDISSNIDDKLFEYTEKSVFNNILMAFNSIPPALVRPENSVFGQSGESIQQMQKVYQNNTSNERDALIEIVQYLMGIFVNRLDNLDLELLIQEKTDAVTNQ